MLIGAWWIWVLALGLYVVFRLWYDNWKGPLSPQEVTDFMNQVSDLKMSEYSDPKDLRAFLQADDGKEFVMVNLVRVHTGELAHPHTGKPTKGIDLLREYGNSFVKVLVRHGGHPVLVMRKVGGYIDSWNTPPDPGWHVAGSMRYRSRRDMMLLALDHSVKQVHILKTAATSTTFSFPSQVVLGLAIRPRLWVALVLALGSALVHLVSVISLVPS
jgi:hypothetical protein